MAGARDLVTLASASPRRRELLSALGYRLIVAPADLDEDAVAEGLPPDQAAMAVAAAKAAVADARRATVLAADTMVVLAGRILGKPRGPADAAGMLLALRARRHEVVTAVVVGSEGVTHRALERSTVLMRAYGRDEIDAYVATGGGADKAGAYGIQDEPFRPVETIEGCWCNVMGLPLWTAVRLLAHAGATPPLRPDQAFERCAGCPLAA